MKPFTDLNVTSIDQLTIGCKVKVKPETYSYAGACISDKIIYTIKEIQPIPAPNIPEHSHAWWNIFLFYGGLHYWVKHTNLILIPSDEPRFDKQGQEIVFPAKEEALPINQLEYKVEDLL